MTVLSTSTGLHRSINVFGVEIILDLPIPALVLSVVGGLFLLNKTWSVLRLLLDLTLLRGTSVTNFKSRDKESWAIVTGATAGMGAEFARQLAAKGFSIILIGRREGATQEVASDISTKYKVQTKVLTIDVANAASRATGFAQVQKLSQELDVGILVNNVGASHDIPVPFVETTPEEMDSIIQTNVYGTLEITRAVLPSLIERSARGGPKSLIMNLGSLTGRIPSSYLATYSMTKGGLMTWTKALAQELSNSRIVVTLVQPAYVESNMSRMRRAWSVPSAKDFVRSTLKSIELPVGAQGRNNESTPYPAHAIIDYAVGFFGSFSENYALQVTDKLHRDVRQRALRKRAKLTKKQ